MYTIFQHTSLCVCFPLLLSHASQPTFTEIELLNFGLPHAEPYGERIPVFTYTQIFSESQTSPTNLRLPWSLNRKQPLERRWGKCSKVKWKKDYRHKYSSKAEWSAWFYFGAAYSGQCGWEMLGASSYLLIVSFDGLVCCNFTNSPNIM